MKLVIYPAVDRERFEKIQGVSADLTVINAVDEQTTVAEIADADAFFGKLTPTMLAKATRLRWVQSPTASLEHYLFPALTEHPCTLTNMRGLFFDVIADQVFGYILCFARNLHLYLRQQIDCVWEPIGGEAARASMAAGPGNASAIDQAHIHLADCTLGIVGLGSIGGEVARRARAFGMQVFAVDPNRAPVPGSEEPAWPLERLPDLLAVSHFVVIAAPHTPDTVKLFRSAQFQQMRPDAFLINVGRGVIVDLKDLIRALESKQIAGAALDVFEVEPLPTGSPLWQMQNVIITPHIAASSVRVPERHLAVLLENVRRFVNGEPLQNPVDKAMWY